MSTEYSKIRRNVIIIERLKELRSKSNMCPWGELCEFLTQCDSGELDSSGLSENAKVQMEKASKDFVDRMCQIMDAEIGDRMKDLDAVPDYELGQDLG